MRSSLYFLIAAAMHLTTLRAGSCECEQLKESDWIHAGKWEPTLVAGNEFGEADVYYLARDGSARIVSSSVYRVADGEIGFDVSSNLLYWAGRFQCRSDSVEIVTKYFGRVPVSTDLPISDPVLAVKGTVFRHIPRGKQCVIASDGAELVRATMVPKKQLKSALRRWPPHDIKNP